MWEAGERNAIADPVIRLLADRKRLTMVAKRLNIQNHALASVVKRFFHRIIIDMEPFNSRR